MTKISIEKLLPHSGPMCLLDDVVDFGDGWFRASVEIRRDSQFITEEGVPAWVGIEYMGQAIAAYAGQLARNQNQPVEIGLLVSARQYKSVQPFFLLGSHLLISVKEACEELNGLQSFDCMIHPLSEQKKLFSDSNILVKSRLNVYRPTDAGEFLAQSKA